MIRPVIVLAALVLAATADAAPRRILVLPVDGTADAATRARLTADGQLYTCLFATRGHDLRALLRGGASDDDIEALLRALWHRRTDRYSEIRSENTIDLPKVEMSYIGG